MVLLNKNLEQMYNHLSSNLGKGLDSGLLKSYPKMIYGMESDMKNCKKNVENFNKDYDQSRAKLNIALGEVDVLEKMKEAHEEEQKRKTNIKKEQEIEDIINMRRVND